MANKVDFDGSRLTSTRTVPTGAVLGTGIMSVGSGIVVDGAGSVTITGDLYRLVGTGTWSQTGIKYGSHARAAGNVFECTINVSSITTKTGAMFGLMASQALPDLSATNPIIAVYHVDGELKVRFGATDTSIHTISAATAYRLAIEQQATGYKVYRHDGSIWQLEHTEVTGSDATLFPFISAKDNHNQDFSVVDVYDGGVQ